MIAAAVPAIAITVLVGVPATYREIPPIILSAALGPLMAFIAYGRMVLQPLL